MGRTVLFYNSIVFRISLCSLLNNVLDARGFNQKDSNKKEDLVLKSKKEEIEYHNLRYFFHLAQHHATPFSGYFRSQILEREMV